MTTHAVPHAKVDAKAAIWAGLIAGIVFMMAEMLMVAMFLGQSAWGPPRMIAAMLLGRDVLPPPATFDIVVMMVAMMIHFMLSIILAFVLALIAKGRSLGTAVLIGAIFGLVIYLVNFYGMTAVFPWFAEARNWVSILAHVLFGVVLGAVYAARAHDRVVHTDAHTHRTA
jgi:uncharacterized membrane protein YagU involved in acid resistance